VIPEDIKNLQNLLRLKLPCSRRFPHYACVSWTYCRRPTHFRYGN